MTPEGRVVAKIVAELKKMRAAGAKIWWYKRHGGPLVTAGLPDFHVIYNGLSSDIEVKAPGNKPSKIQEHVILEINLAGGHAGWVDNWHDFLKFMLVKDSSHAERR